MTYEKRIIELESNYSSLGYPVIAINANDPEVSKGASFDKMQKLAKEKKYNFPYLFDNGQKVTNQYGARNTPHLFLVSRSAKGIWLNIQEQLTTTQRKQIQIEPDMWNRQLPP